LGYSPCPPVSVCGTDFILLARKSFSWKISWLLCPICIELKANPITLVVSKSPSLYWKKWKGRNINRLNIEVHCEAHPLDPPNPWLIFIAKETLGFRWSDISSDLRLLVPTFLLLYPPPFFTKRLHWIKNTPLPYQCKALVFVSSVFDLAPLHFRRKNS